MCRWTISLYDDDDTLQFISIASTSSSSSASSDQLQTTFVSFGYTKFQHRSSKTKMNGGLQCYERVRFPTQVDLADKYFSLFNFIARHLNSCTQTVGLTTFASRMIYLAAICKAFHDSYMYYLRTMTTYNDMSGQNLLFVGIVKIKSWS